MRYLPVLPGFYWSLVLQREHFLSVTYGNYNEIDTKIDIKYYFHDITQYNFIINDNICSAMG